MVGCCSFWRGERISAQRWQAATHPLDIISLLFNLLALLCFQTIKIGSPQHLLTLLGLHEGLLSRCHLPEHLCKSAASCPSVCQTDHKHDHDHDHLEIATVVQSWISLRERCVHAWRASGLSGAVRQKQLEHVFVQAKLRAVPDRPGLWQRPDRSTACHNWRCNQ